MAAPGSAEALYLFLLWSAARDAECRILADLRVHFQVVDVVEVTWSTGETFARSLSRMYGDALPVGSEKELHCGTGPFLAVVVSDPRPRYRPRRTGRGITVLNSNVFDARRRYRTWTGGGHRVHASDSRLETERNLVLLLGRPATAFAGRSAAVGSARCMHGDPAGSHGWTSLEELLQVLEPYGAHAVEAGPGRVTLLATDLWWAEQIAGGEASEAGSRTVLVADEPVELVLVQAPAAQGPLAALRRAVDRRFLR